MKVKLNKRGSEFERMKTVLKKCGSGIRRIKTKLDGAVLEVGV